MRICYRDKKFHAKSLQLIELCNEILADMKAQGYDLTLRQLYYQLVARAVIANNERSYNNVGAMISNARLAGLIDWDDIVDRTRHVRALSHWNKPADIIKGAAQQFRYDLWKGQPIRVEVWVEKDALVDVIGQACTRLDVPFFSCRGYTSQSEMWGAAQRLMQYQEHDGAERVVILHLGDHDPSGLDMTRDIDERLCGFHGYHGFLVPEIKRIALNIDQVRKYNPPPNPAKLSDCRAPKYIAEHGDESWELDALNPSVIDALITKNINALLDPELFAAEKERQAAARKELAEIADGYGDIKENRARLSLATESLRLVNDDLTSVRESFHGLQAQFDVVNKAANATETELLAAKKQIATLKRANKKKKGKK